MTRISGTPDLIFSSRDDFCLNVLHQLGKVIEKNQPDATMIY